MSKRILLFFFLLALVSTGCAGKLPFGEEWLKEPKYGGGEAVCLDKGIAETGFGQVLKDIPRPLDERMARDADGIYNMYPTPLTDVCSAPAEPEGACNPDVSDYVLVATDVRVGQVFLGPDRLIAKQFSTVDSPLLDEHKDRLYRAFCGDWCWDSSLSEGYRGTFYCDFILYAKQAGTPSSKCPGALPFLGNENDCELPPDDTIFDIFFKKGAEIPEKIKCKNGDTAQTAAEESTEPQFFINFNDIRWFFREEGNVKKKDIMKEKPAGPRWLMGTIDIPELGGDTFKMFVDLLFDAPEDEEETIIYAVEETEAGKINNPGVDGQERITYYEFQKAEEWKPGGRTLQLGTFKPPITAGWFKTWLTESKPAIYLYPKEPTRISVKLDPAGKLTVTDPPYDLETGWEVLAFPSGLLKLPITYDLRPTTYSYLYYEADLEKVFVSPEGFVVEGQNLVEFFEEVLPKIGLNQWEIGDFIKYWMGRLDRSQPYYFIHFLSNEQIEELEPLELSVQPETEIRMRAYFKPLEKPMNVESQILETPPERKGFVLVEWGGMLDTS